MTEDEEVGLDYDEAWKKVRKEHSEILSATGREGGRMEQRWRSDGAAADGQYGV